MMVKEYGFDNITIKDICDNLNISNGMFYQYFKTKEEPLAYQLIVRYENSISQSESNSDDFMNQILDTNKRYLEHCKEKGPEICGIVYSINKINNNLLGLNKFGLSWYNIDFLLTAQRNGYIKSDAGPVLLINDCCVILRGVILSWCIDSERIDPEGTCERLTRNYLSYYATEKYFSEFAPAK